MNSTLFAGSKKKIMYTYPYILVVLKNHLNRSLNKMNKCMYIKYVYHILFITDMFGSPSDHRQDNLQDYRVKTDSSNASVNHSVLQRMSETFYTGIECWLIYY